MRADRRHHRINDVAGEPLFVVTAEANAGLVKVLLDLCKDIRALVGERRVTIVFDRGGWSPKLFQKLIADGFDILTYRKGRAQRRLRWELREHRAVLDGREVVYQLADHGIRLLQGKLELRQPSPQVPSTPSAWRSGTCWDYAAQKVCILVEMSYPTRHNPVLGIVLSMPTSA